MLTCTLKVKGFSCHHVLFTKMTLTDLGSTHYRQTIATTQFLYSVLKKKTKTKTLFREDKKLFSLPLLGFVSFKSWIILWLWRGSEWGLVFTECYLPIIVNACFSIDQYFQCLLFPNWRKYC